MWVYDTFTHTIALCDFPLLETIFSCDVHFWKHFLMWLSVFGNNVSVGVSLLEASLDFCSHIYISVTLNIYHRKYWWFKKNTHKFNISHVVKVWKKFRLNLYQHTCTFKVQFEYIITNIHLKMFLFVFIHINNTHLQNITICIYFISWLHHHL